MEELDGEAQVLGVLHLLAEQLLLALPRQQRPVLGQALLRLPAL